MPSADSEKTPVLKRIFNIHSIKFKVIAVIIVVSILVLLIQILYIAPTITNRNIHKYVQRQEELADQIAGNIDFELEQALLELEEIANFPSLESMDSRQVDKTITEINKIAGFINHYCVLDKNGLWFSHPIAPHLIGKSISEENQSWVRETLKKDRTVFLNVLPTSLGSLVSGFATPIHSGSGEPIGLLRAVIVVSEANSILNTIKNINIGASGYAYVVANNGHLLAHPYIDLKSNQFDSYNFQDYKPVQGAVQGESGVADYYYEDEIWIAAYRPIKTTGWGVIVQQPKFDVVRVAKEKVTFITIFFSLSFFLCALALAFIIHYALKPLTTLLQNIKAGYPESKPAYKKDEIGQLAQEFDSLYLNLIRSEASYRESSERFRQMAENIDEAFWMEDINESKVIYVNPAYKRMFDLSEKRAYETSYSWTTVLHSEDYAKLQSKIARGLKEIESFVFRVQKADNKIRWIQSRIFHIKNSKGDINRLVGIAEDITSRKRVEDNLKESEKRYRALFEDSPIPIWIEDFSEVKTYIEQLKNSGVTNLRRYLEEHPDEVSTGMSKIKVTDVNRAVFDLYKAESIKDFKYGLTDIICEESSDISRECLIAISEDRKNFESDSMNQTLKGDKMSVIMSWSVVPGHESTMSRVLVSIIDITERRQLEEQLRQSQKMEAVGRLAGGIAHDFNNLLTAITGYSEILNINNKLDKSSTRNINEIKKAADRAASLTQQLLAFSRKQIMQPKIIDLNMLLLEIEKMLRRVIGEDVIIQTKLSGGLGKVRADPTQMEQVIMNLALNARDAMPAGGKLTIETKNECLKEQYCNRFSEVNPGDYVLLSVQDTGHGMEEETMKNIFEPFFTTKEIGKGTGLGLSMVFGIIKQSDGHISVSSQVNRGATFNIYLPRIDRGDEKKEKIRGVTGARRGTETILIVEDENIVRNLLCDVLKKYKYRVLEAVNAADALRVVNNFDSKKIHLMITDIVMPGENGFQLAENMEELFPRMKVLYISGYTQSAIGGSRIYKPKATFLQKPFTPSDLIKSVRKILDT
jgi:PAS domain S-box-containing protein